MAADVCAVEHLHPTEVFDEPQPRHNQMVIEVDDPVLGPIEQVAPPIRFDGTSPRSSRRRPARPAHRRDPRRARPSDRRDPRPLRPAPADERPLLHDVKILDIGAYYAGPYSSRLLADLGADVIKLEPTLGDPLRGIERPLLLGAGREALDRGEPEGPRAAARDRAVARLGRRRAPQHAARRRRAAGARRRADPRRAPRRGLPVRAGLGIERSAHDAAELRADAVRLRRASYEVAGAVQPADAVHRQRGPGQRPPRRDRGADRAASTGARPGGGLVSRTRS